MTPNAARPASSVPPTAAVTVLLTTEQAVKLDELSVAIRRATGKAVSRSALIRAFTAALLPYGGTLHTCRSQSEISVRISQTMAMRFSKVG